MNLSEFFKNEIYKSNLSKTFQTDRLQSRMDNLKNDRKQTRTNIMYQKRQIDDNITPVSTPNPKHFKNNPEESKKESVSEANAADNKTINNTNRLELLAKWKAQKAKRKAEEKLKSKPIFKVCHVSEKVNLDKAMNEIKGKPIKKNPTPMKKSQFAPTNHQFRAPANVKPINMSQTSKTDKTASISKENSKSSRQNAVKKLDFPSTSKDAGKKCSPKRTRLNSGSRANSAPVQVKKAEIKSKPTTRLPPKAKTNDKIDVKTKKVDPKLNENKIKTTKSNETSQSMESLTEKKVDPIQSNKIDSKLKEGSSKVTEKKMEVESNPIRARGRPKKEVAKITKTVSAESKAVNQKTPKKPTEKEAIASKVTKAAKPKAATEKTPSRPTKKPAVTPKPSTSQAKTDKTPVRLTRQAKVEYVTPVSKKTVKSDTPDSKKPVASEKTPLRLTNKRVRIDSETPEVGRKPIERANTPYNKVAGWDVEKLGETEVEEKEDVNNRQVLESVSSTSSKSNNSTSASVDFPIETDPDTPITPKMPNIEKISESPVYISPFVTISRGKHSARKEFHARNSLTVPLDSPTFEKDIYQHTSEKAGAEYFTKKLQNEIERIEGVCDVWKKYKDENDLPEEANDLIDVAIGQSKLLISKKFEQFRGIIEQCRSYQYIEKPITCKDLHGFWDMMYIQVEDLDKRFKNLTTMRDNNWEEVLPVKIKAPQPVKKPRGRPAKAKSSTLRAFIQAARTKSTTDHLQVQTTEKMFELGPFTVKSPIKNVLVTEKTPRSGRKSLRMSVLANEAQRRLSSPGLTMMKISQAIKCGDGLTPSKSILKTEGQKSAKKSVLFREAVQVEEVPHRQDVKSVLFQSDDEDEVTAENDENVDQTNLITISPKLITFSPATPTRKSTRLQKIKS